MAIMGHVGGITRLSRHGRFGLIGSDGQPRVPLHSAGRASTTCQYIGHSFADGKAWWRDIGSDELSGGGSFFKRLATVWLSPRRRTSSGVSPCRGCSTTCCQCGPSPLRATLWPARTAPSAANRDASASCWAWTVVFAPCKRVAFRGAPVPLTRKDHEPEPDDVGGAFGEPSEAHDSRTPARPQTEETPVPRTRNRVTN
jgi:hypothetical protein